MMLLSSGIIATAKPSVTNILKRFIRYTTAKGPYGTLLSDNDPVTNRRSEFRDHPITFLQFQPKYCEFQVGKNPSNEPAPIILYKKQRGLEHLTPWSEVHFAHLGLLRPVSSLGTYQSSPTTPDGKFMINLYQEVAIADTPLLASEIYNYDMFLYFEFWRTLETMLKDHLLNEMESYAPLYKSFMNLYSENPRESLSIVNRTNFINSQLCSAIRYYNASMYGQPRAYRFIIGKRKTCHDNKIKDNGYEFVTRPTLVSLYDVTTKRQLQCDMNSIKVNDTVSLLATPRPWMLPSGMFGMSLQMGSITNWAQPRERNRIPVIPSKPFIELDDVANEEFVSEV